MRSVFVYYSLSGNGDYVAEKLKSQGVDIIKLEPKKSLPKAMFLQMFVGGMTALFHYKAKLVQDVFDLAEYEQIIIGTPNWANGCSTPINTFLEKNSLASKKITFIVYSGSGKSDKCMKYVSKKYGIKKFVSLKEPLRNQKETNSVLDKIKV